MSEKPNYDNDTLWNGTIPPPSRESRGGGELPFLAAELAPGVFRPAAQGIAMAVANGPRALNFVLVPLLLLLMVVFLAGEVIEMRSDWYAGTAAQEQTRLFAVQRVREEAETAVAFTAINRNIADEIRAIAGRETDALSAVKEVEAGWGSPHTHVAAPNVHRYDEQFKKVTAALKSCDEQPGSCSTADKTRFAGLADVYEMLFYLTRATFRHHASGYNQVPIPKPTEIGATNAN